MLSSAPMYHCRSQILSNHEIAEHFFELRFRLPDIEAVAASTVHPGHFLTIRTSMSSVPLLRRPFGFASYDPHSREASVLYERRGEATTLLSDARPDDALDLLAPLGNPFPAPSPSARPVLLGGGIGMGPILFMARYYRDRDPLVLIGARRAALLPDFRILAPGLDVKVCTDDGSAGLKGNVLDLLQAELDGMDPVRPEFFLCGPHPMLKAGAGKALDMGASAWVSMEQTMGCAVGACLGCAVRVTDGPGYERVCTEGPVFDARRIKWT